MAHGYRILQHWNQWLSQQSLGAKLLAAEKDALARLLDNHFGKHVVLIGVSQQYDLMDASVIPQHTLLTPLLSDPHHLSCIEGDLHELPILSGSVDLVLLPHTLELVDNPRQLLSEACRIIKPEGLIAICGFNPYSVWGLKKLLTKEQSFPWKANFIHAHKVKSWLELADFQLEEHSSTFYRPPLSENNYFEKLQFLERIGSKCFPVLGGVYILLARAKVVPLTPIRLKWQQRLGNIRISTTMPGPIAQSKIHHRS